MLFDLSQVKRPDTDLTHYTTVHRDIESCLHKNLSSEEQNGFQIHVYDAKKCRRSNRSHR